MARKLFAPLFADRCYTPHIYAGLWPRVVSSVRFATERTGFDSGIAAPARLTVVVPESTAGCAGWGCTCQGFSTKFGTFPGNYHRARRKEERKWWADYECTTGPI